MTERQGEYRQSIDTEQKILGLPLMDTQNLYVISRCGDVLGSFLMAMLSLHNTETQFRTQRADQLCYILRQPVEKVIRLSVFLGHNCMSLGCLQANRLNTERGVSEDLLFDPSVFEPGPLRVDQDQMYQ